MSAHDMSLQDWSAQDMLAQDWSAQDMSLQDWSAQDIEFQDMLALAELAQLIESNDGLVSDPAGVARNFSRPWFGFGWYADVAARLATISPTPAGAGSRVTLRAVRISAPFTWSGVQLGCRASICATVPETTGAANDVPDSWIRSLPTMFDAFSVVIAEPGAIGPTM